MTEALRPWPCLSCGQAFQTRKGLRIHQTLVGHQPPKDAEKLGDSKQPPALR